MHHHHQHRCNNILDRNRDRNEEQYQAQGQSFIAKHPVIANLAIIIAVAVLGICVAYLSIAIFTKHGQSDVVPKVENMSYSRAVEILHDAGFNVDIRDSVYKEDVKPGYVIEQFPKANSVVKPGRKIFLYINAVHPKEVVIDDTRNASEYAMRGLSFRQGMARLQELGFKNIRVVRVLGDTDRIVKVIANGRVVYNMQRIPINSAMIVEVSDGRLSSIRDSLYDLERLREAGGYPDAGGYVPAEPVGYDPATEEDYVPEETPSSSSSSSSSKSNSSSKSSNQGSEEIEYF